MNKQIMTKIPPKMFFGCFGNPVKLEANEVVCGCADTLEKHEKNYKKYLYNLENYMSLGLTKHKSDIEGFFTFK